MSRMVQSRYKQAAAKKSANATLMSEETLNESAFVRNMGQNTALTSSPLKSRPGLIFKYFSYFIAKFSTKDKHIKDSNTCFEKTSTIW